MSTRCAPSRRRSSNTPAAPSSSPMIAGSSTASPLTCWPSRATARSCGSRAITPITRLTGTGAWAPRPISHIAFATSPSLGPDILALLPRRHAAADRAPGGHTVAPLHRAAMRHLLPHDRQQLIRAAAIALQDAGELVALADLHAGAVDVHVGDHKAPAAIRDMPLQLGRAALAHDLAGDD